MVGFDRAGKVTCIEEKPKRPASNYAVVGLYFYNNDVVKVASELKPSARGEYEITDVNRYYLERGDLVVRLMSRGIAWLDTGTHASLADANSFVRAVQDRQGLKIACLEEIAWRQGFITTDQLKALAESQRKSTYGEYLNKLVFSADF